MQKKFIVLSVFIFISLACRSQFHTETIFLEFEGCDRNYEIFVPDNYSSDKSYPVVLILHGGGGTARGLVRSTRARFNTLANRDEFIAVYPNGVKKSWNDGARDTIAAARKLKINDVGFIKEIISDLNTKVNIDEKNIFACGISNGGFMAQRLAFELSEKIKGIGVVAANLSKIQSEKKFPQRPVSVLFINGTADPLVPYYGGYVTVLRQRRGEVLSVDESIDTWKRIDNCTILKSEDYIPDKQIKDHCFAKKTIWQNPDNSSKVVEIKIENGGHTWPGSRQNLPRRLVGNTNQDFNACDEIWNFFHSLNN